MAVVFAAFAGEGDIALSDEHVEYASHDTFGATERFARPREVAALRDIVALLGSGDAREVEGVLRVY